MKVIIEFIRNGNVAHTKEVEISNIGLLRDRMNSQFSEYNLIVSERELFGFEANAYDKYIRGSWYHYTGRMVWIHSPYSSEWWREYEDDEGNVVIMY